MWVNVKGSENVKRLFCLLITLCMFLGTASALAEDQAVLIAPWVDDCVFVFRLSETEGLSMYERDLQTGEEQLRIHHADVVPLTGFATSPETLSYYYIMLDGLYRHTVELYPSGEWKDANFTRIADVPEMGGKNVQAAVVDNWYVYIDPDTGTVQKIPLT